VLYVSETRNGICCAVQYYAGPEVTYGVLYVSGAEVSYAMLYVSGAEVTYAMLYDAGPEAHVGEGDDEQGGAGGA
jgi:hypothetical protein